MRCALGASLSSKLVVLATTSWIGGKNDFLGTTYLIVGIIALLLGAVFAFKHVKSPRRLGDTQFLVWNK